MYKLSGFQTMQGLAVVSAPNAVLRITEVRIPRTPAQLMVGSIAATVTKQAVVACSIYDSADDVTANNPPIATSSATFSDYAAIAPDLAASTAFTDNFGGEVTPPTGLDAPTSEQQALVMQAYLALPSNPALTALLTGATVL